MSKKLCKSRYDVKLDGVCAGVANYLGIDVAIVRIIWVLVSLTGGTGVIAYLACMLIMPRQPESFDTDYNDNHQN